ncbi:MAG: glycosyltransferase [Solirubrobacteraceae bacterium]
MNAAATADRPVALYVITDLPFPPRSGNHLRYLQIARALEMLGWSVRIVACAVRADAAEASIGPAGKLEALIRPQAPTTRPLERAARAARIAAMIARGVETDPFAATYVRAGLDATVGEVVARVQPDAIVLRSLFAHLVPALRAPRRPVVLDVHDATPLMTKLLSASAPALQRVGLAARYRIARRTDRLMAGADELWVPSTREVTYFAERAAGVSAILVPNGIDVADDAAPCGPRSDHDLLLIGNFGWPANLHAADTLVEAVLPAVRRHVPEARVVLVGRDLPEDRSRRWADLPVEWRGVVPDIEPILKSAAAFVFAPPAWAISAMPLKVAEALASGTLLAASPSALGGFPLRHGVEALVREDPTELGSALGEALEIPGRGAQISDAGRHWARATLSVDSVVERLRRESLLGAASRR